MTARILVVDDIAVNVKLLEARLSAEYFEVMTATNGHEALALCEREMFDIILLDVMMPGIDGFETCFRIKSNPKTAHIPVIMVTALDQPEDRVKGLKAGADDFLTKPIDDLQLITRVKSLVRLKMLTDELRIRAQTSKDMGLLNNATEINVETRGAQILIIDDMKSSAERMADSLRKMHQITILADANEVMREVTSERYEMIIISLDMQSSDALRLCSQFRTIEQTRNIPILMVLSESGKPELMRALELGVNDYVIRPLDSNELIARTSTQIKRKRYNDLLRQAVDQTMEMAITDQLTGLFNRHYFESHFQSLSSLTDIQGKPLSVLILDIDFFKSVNDTYGHDVGDEVLRIFAKRLKQHVRSIDLPCRFGGEEFVVLMPDTDLGLATSVAERIRQSVASSAFVVSGGKQNIQVTVSVGCAMKEQAQETAQSILKRADQALYIAKRDGRNRVVTDAA